MTMAIPRMTGQRSIRRRQSAPDYDKYGLHLGAMPTRNPRGTPVPYSTDGPEEPYVSRFLAMEFDDEKPQVQNG